VSWRKSADAFEFALEHAIEAFGAIESIGSMSMSQGVEIARIEPTQPWAAED